MPTDIYQQRGVSAGKEDVHKAIERLSKGAFPNAFCKILPTAAAGRFCIMHADTAGTKTSLAYLYWKESGDISVWRGIAQDALVMNLDDMACAGATGPFLISSTIGRNKHLIPGAVLEEIIGGTTDFIQKMAEYGIQIDHAGGETADVGDIVRTADVGFTVYAELKETEVLDIDIQPGMAIIGLGSDGQATYETDNNSGIGSNGLTFARHELLHNHYASRYSSTYSPETDGQYVYTGNHFVTDRVKGLDVPLGQALLSPTRTFLPFLLHALAAHRADIGGIIHNTGGGHSKVLKFLPQNVRVIKDNLPAVPAIFNLIQKERNTAWADMYRFFNMGTRLEIYCNPSIAPALLALAAELSIPAQQIGHTIAAPTAIHLTTPSGEMVVYG